MDSAQTLVVIPTYNERASLPDLLDELQRQNRDVLVVDDASPDGTGAYKDERAKTNSGIYCIHRAKKLGLGSAYREGFQWALTKKYERIIQMDADGSHNPSALPTLMQKAQNTDLVIGSRYILGGGITDWSFFRRVLSRFGNAYINIILRLKNRKYGIQDSTSGYRIWSREALEKIQLHQMRSDGYAFQVETAWAAIKKNLNIQEVPIMFRDRTAGSSKIGRSNILDTLILPWKLN